MFDRINKLNKKASNNLGFMTDFVEQLVIADETAKEVEKDAKIRIVELETIKSKASKARNYSKKLLKVLGE